MISSKELIEKTGISRATLNNYINLGLLPRPDVRFPAPDDGDARRLGYFPDEALRRIDEIQRLKDEGMSMAEIVTRFAAQGLRDAGDALDPAVRRDGASAHRPGDAPAAASDSDDGTFRITLADLPTPCYMLNYNFEIIWHNEAARRSVLGGFETLPSSSESRNVFAFLQRGRACVDCGPCETLLRFHFAVAKRRSTKGGFFALCKDAPAENLGTLERLYQEAEPLPQQAVSQQTVDAPGDGGRCEPHTVYAAQFREGILFAYVPGEPASDSLLALLARRDEVIRDLARKRLPVLTHVAVLVADLQDSVKICAELPPEEYFELVNQIWSTMEPIFRRYYGTYGKHAGDGMVYYFFPQPDCSYVMNALAAAHEVREAMRRISKDWQLRKGWANELTLNTGLNEGQEWLGTFQTATHVEFTVLGDTINHAARLSDFARHGAIWATKNMLGKLDAQARRRIKFGVHRAGDGGRAAFVASTYVSVGSLLDPAQPRSEKLREIAALPVTEIVEVLNED
ncbi:MAG: adenylate/guanylate cyclase domain-containing protein [Burkholderiales bacterium]|nr:adenylate/guanylate cyclase domain-containing protein [Burkholderiales bacterium]